MSSERPKGFPAAPAVIAPVPFSYGRAGDRIVQGVTSATWFGPLQPIEPAVRPEMAEILGVLGRQFDYGVGYNLRIVPRQEEPLSFDQLRQLAEGLDVLKLVIETRKDEYAALKWRFAEREGYTASDAELKEVSEFWESPDKQNNWDEWLRALLNDRFIIDAATVYPRPTRKGEIKGSSKGATYCFELLDGATIKPLIDGRGRLPRPPSVAYQQILKGMPAVEYTTDELVYRPRNVRSNHVYGFPEVEQIAMTVNIALRRELHKLQSYTEGNIPEALISVPKEWSVEQIATYQAYWDSILAGNTAERRHAKFIPDGSKYIPTKESSLKSDFDEWLIRVICYCFSLSPAPFVKMMNRATAQTQQEASQEQGLLPGMRWIINLINSLTWTYLNRPNVVFSWEEEKSTDPLVQTQIMKIWVDSKIQSPKQCAELLGLDWNPEEFIEPAHITEQVQAAPAPEAGSGKQEAAAQPSAAAKNPEVLPPGQKEPAGAKPAATQPAAKLAKADKAQKYRLIDRPDRDGPEVVKAQKSVANRINTIFKKQKGAFLHQAEEALKEHFTRRREAAKQQEKMEKGHVPVAEMDRDQQKAVFASLAERGDGAGSDSKGKDADSHGTPIKETSLSEREVSQAKSEYDSAKAAHEAALSAHRSYGNVNNEGAEGYNPHGDTVRASQSRLDRASEKLADAHLKLETEQKNAEWTPKVTQDRREAWNGAARELIDQGKTKFTGQDVLNLESKMGFKFSDLKSQISRHGL